MKFEYFYEDVIEEARGRAYSEDKLDNAVSMMDEVFKDFFLNRPAEITKFPNLDYFKKAVKSVEGEDYDVEDPESLVLGMVDQIQDMLDGKLNVYTGLNKSQQTAFFRDLTNRFPEVKKVLGPVLGFKEQKWKEGGRGRRPKSAMQPTSDLPPEFQGRKLIPLTPSKPSPDVEDDFIGKTPSPETSSEPKRRGRPMMSGPQAFKRFEDKLYKVHNSLESQLSKMKELIQQMGSRADYFGKQ